MNDVTVCPFDVNLGHAGILGNGILLQLNALREVDPIHWSDSSGCWIITRHADVIDALDGKFPLSCKRLVQVTFPGIAPENRERLFPNIMRYLPNWIIDVDPPVHTRLRKLLIAALNRKVVDAVKPFVQLRVSTLLDKLENQPVIEFGEEIGRQLPGSTILKLLGISQEYLPRLRGWANSFQEAIAVPGVSIEALQRAERSFAEMNELFTQVIEERRKAPQEDLITALVQANDAGDKLSLEEMLGAIQLTIVAGHDTTHNTLSLGMAALAEHPEYWDYMYCNPDKIQDTVMELMRHMAMSTSQPRVITEDFEWHGKQLKAGQVAFIMLAGGNRDPRVFADPERLDPCRGNIQGESLVFAPGMHHCIGHLLGKLQVQEFFGEMVKRFEGADLLDAKLNFMPQIAFRGLYNLNVRMIPRRKS